MNEAVLTDGAELPAASPGAQLAAAREVRGLSIADIAQQLKLSTSQVAALESGDYRRLPGAVFVRGFIRNYARLVKLDAATLLAHVEHELPQAVPASPAMQLSAEIPFPTARSFAWQKYAVAATGILISLVLFEFYQEDEHRDAVTTRQVEIPVPRVIAELPPVEQGAPVAAPAPPSTQVKEAPPAMTNQKPVRNAVEATPVATVVTARGEQRVRLRFSRESWVEIRDRDGRKIFSQLNSRGTEQVVSGVPPLSFIIGNANGVQLIHNEQPVDLGPHTKVDVARLTLE
jgi:cytoskeleton protein RodZ